MRKIALVFGLFAWLGAAEVDAAPSSVSFAGRLSTAAGPVNGAVNVVFTVFDAQAGGTSVWSDPVAVTADQGLVLATLGRSGNELDETVFTGADRFLEIAVQGETLSPRLSINSVPYAVRSSEADSADLLGTLAPGDVVTTISAGAGLTGGGSGNTVPIGVDFNRVQTRVTATCPPGQSIRAISDTGGVTCEVDSNTTYVGGAGISISGATVSLASTGCAAGSVWKYTGTGFACVPEISLSNCTWESTDSTLSTQTGLRATCTTGRYPISGGCDPAGSATVQLTRPDILTLPPPDGTTITGAMSWYCQFSAGAVGHKAIVLCCAIN